MTPLDRSEPYHLPGTIVRVVHGARSMVGMVFGHNPHATEVWVVVPSKRARAGFVEYACARAACVVSSPSAEARAEIEQAEALRRAAFAAANGKPKRTKPALSATEAEALRKGRDLDVHHDRCIGADLWLLSIAGGRQPRAWAAAQATVDRLVALGFCHLVAGPGAYYVLTP